MVERHNTVVCTFDTASPHISAFDIHEWLHDVLRLQEHTVRMIQVDGPKRQVYIKLVDKEDLLNLLRITNGQAEYKHHTGEISVVSIVAPGMGTKRVRIANLPPEVQDEAIRTALTPYGTVMNVQEEMWSKSYRYAVSNGIHQVTVLLTTHIPSNITVAGCSVLLSYVGQPVTCYGCGAIGHLYPTCPTRQLRKTVPQELSQTSYASIAATTVKSPAPQSDHTPQMMHHTITERDCNPRTQQPDIDHQEALRGEGDPQNFPPDPATSMTIAEHPNVDVGEQQSNDRHEEGRDDPMEHPGPHELMTKQDRETPDQVLASEHTSKARHVVKTCSVSTLDDTSTDEKDTTLTQQNMHGTHNDTPSSPKKTKK
jgi:hypothetical protein